MTKRVLGLRTSRKDRTSYGHFQWPSSGRVVAPDWSPIEMCGNGLHALLGGIGDSGLLNWDDDAIWQAVWIDPDTIVDLGGKVKFPECEIAIDGTREEVIKFMVAHGADATEMVGGISIGKKSAIANGYNGMATAVENFAQATANGCMGTAVAIGTGSFATANGKLGRATANGLDGKATANGELGQATASGQCGMATAAGYNGRATANGEYGRAYSGSVASAGPKGTVTITYRDDDNKFRVVTGYVGEDGIEPGVFYRVKDGRLVRGA